MALNPADIAVVSQLLDQALALEAEARQAWLAALPSEHQQHADTLRDMLAQEAGLDSDPRLHTMPKLPMDESVAHEGDRVGPYRLIKEIGRGGMGSVWLAERADGAYKRQVALKLPRLAWGAGLAERMAREREIGMLLEHSNIARLYDAGVDERGRPYLALEFVDGQPIEAWCEAQGLNVRERLKLFVQVIKAVGYAHGRLVVHRDLKPSNVLVTPDGQAHLLDFGIAKLLLEAAPGEVGLTQEQGRVLTPHYASPEQVAGEAITVQSDVYSLGVLLYELLTGTLPITAKRDTRGAVEEAILQGDVPLASSRVADRARARALRGEVDAILAQALQREPARRYAAADAMGADIARHLAGETVGARRDSALYRLRKAARRHWVALGATVAVGAAMAAGGTVALIQMQRAAQQAERARVATQFVTELFRTNTQAPAEDAAPTMLDKGARLIVTRFRDQPDLQAELFGVVGRVYADLGAHALASDFANREIKLLEVMPTDRQRLAEARLLLARAAAGQDDHEEAERQAAAVLASLRPDDRLWADALVVQARAQFKQGHQTQARASAAELERQLSAQGRTGTAANAWALWLKGDFAADTRDTMRWQQAALALITQAEGLAASETIEMQLELGRRLLQLNREDEGNPLFDRAIATLRALGGVNAIRADAAQATEHYVRCYMGLESHAVSIAGLENSRHAVIAARSVTPPIVLADIEHQLGTCHYQWSDFDAAERMFDASEPVIRGSRPSMMRRAGLVGMRSSMDTVRGEHGRAAAATHELIQLRHQMGSYTKSFEATSWSSLVMNHLMAGDYVAADAVLAKAPAFEANAGDPLAGQYYARVLPLARVRLLLERGDAQGALAALPQPPLRDTQTNPALENEGALRGEVLCAAGRSLEGLTLLRESIGQIVPDVGPGDPGLAHIRAAAGLCALAAGHRHEAEAWAAAARAGLAMHTRLSPWYGRALAELDRRLKLR